MAFYRPPAKQRAVKLVAGLTLAAAAVIASACSSYNNASGLNIGPSFPSMTLYATNSNQNAISIYTQGAASGSGPEYQIAGSSTTMNGPQYLAFDQSNNLWVTNYNPSTNAGLLVEIAALATGNVVALNSTSVPGQPRGIAITATTPSPAATTSASPSPNPIGDIMVIADVDPTYQYPSSLMLYTEGSTSPYESIAGALTGLNVPSGVALDVNNNVYVTNLQGRSVQQFVLPTPSPTPKPTHSPSPTPSPSSSPSSSPSPTPTPTGTPTPLDLAPNFTLQGAKTGVISPTGVAVAHGDIFVADQGNPKASCASKLAPAILVFPIEPKEKYPIDRAPLRKIQGCKTQLYSPTDVKLNGSGLIYVADFSRKTGKGVILIFAASAKGNVAPTTTYTSPGAVTGVGLVP